MIPKILSAGVIVVYRKNDEWQYLLLRNYNYWDFPKGVVEQGEAPLDAARREVREETTLENLDFKWGNDFRETPAYNRGKVARYYIAATDVHEVSLPINPDLGRPEHQEFRWFSYSEVRPLLSPRLLPIIDWAHELIGR